MFSFLLTLGVGFAFFTLFLYFNQSRLLYMPLTGHAGNPADLGLAHEEITLVTHDGVRLHAWYLPSATAQTTVLYLHGNAGNISHRLETLAGLHNLGVNVLIPDYRGYGRSEGRPDEEGTYSDARAAWDYLVDTRGVSAADIVIYGRSLGGAIGARLASEQDCGGLILESAFSSLPDLARQLYPWLPARQLTRFSYDTAASLRDTRCPVLIAHSRHDEIVPYSHAGVLLAHAGQRGRQVDINGDHNVAFSGKGGKWIKTLKHFLDNPGHPPATDPRTPH